MRSVHAWCVGRIEGVNTRPTLRDLRRVTYNTRDRGPEFQLGDTADRVDYAARAMFAKPVPAGRARICLGGLAGRQKHAVLGGLAARRAHQATVDVAAAHQCPPSSALWCGSAAVSGQVGPRVSVRLPGRRVASARIGEEGGRLDAAFTACPLHRSVSRNPWSTRVCR